MRRKLIYTIVAVAIVFLLAVIAFPYFVPAQFTSSGRPITFSVRLVAQDSAPIQSAEVQIKLKARVTDADGYCRLEHLFPASGTVRRSGQSYFSGNLRAIAPPELE